MTDPVRAGVIGVGTMGRHHARIYGELPGVTLVGVTDADETRATAIAADHGTRAMDRDALLEAVDVVSVAVPTRYHYDAVRAAIDHGVDVLVEKPFVEDPDRGRELIAAAREAGVTLQVGHVERFNPAVRTVAGLIDDLDVIAIDASRLGPPLDREMDDGVALDLMIHDIDVARSLVPAPVASIEAAGTADEQYVTATLTFEDDTVARLTASRVTQEKVRELSVTAADCRVNVDYGDQSVEIHRHELPEYVVDDGDVRYRHERITEHPTVDNGEPLRAELEAFVEAATTGTEPVVTGEDGLRALELAREVAAAATVERPEVVQ